MHSRRNFLGKLVAASIAAAVAPILPRKTPDVQRGYTTITRSCKVVGEVDGWKRWELDGDVVHRRYFIVDGKETLVWEKAYHPDGRTTERWVC